VKNSPSRVEGSKPSADNVWREWAKRMDARTIIRFFTLRRLFVPLVVFVLRYTLAPVCVTDIASHSHNRHQSNRSLMAPGRPSGTVKRVGMEHKHCELTRETKRERFFLIEWLYLAFSAIFNYKNIKYKIQNTKRNKITLYNIIYKNTDKVQSLWFFLSTNTITS